MKHQKRKKSTIVGGKNPQKISHSKKFREKRTTNTKGENDLNSIQSNKQKTRTPNLHPKSFLLKLAVLVPMLVKKSSNACPAFQKFNPTQNYPCQASSGGTAQTISCLSSTSIEKFTFVTWVKYPADPSVYSIGAADGRDIIFSLKSPTETARRVTLQYKPATGFIVRLGRDVLTVQSEADISTVADTEADITRFRTHWQLLIISVDYRSGIKSSRWKIAYFDQTAAGGTDQSFRYNTQLKLRGSGDGAAEWTALKSDTQLAMQGSPGGSDYGGCSTPGPVWMFFDFVPTNMDSTDEAAQLEVIKKYILELETVTAPKLLLDYSIRIKNTQVTNLLKECTITVAMDDQFKNVDNTYIQDGVHIGYGDYYECVSSNIFFSSDFTLSFKFYFSSYPTEEINIVAFVVRQRENLYDGTKKNNEMPLFTSITKLGIFLLPNGKLRISSLGIPYELAMGFVVNTGYTVTLNFLRFDEETGAGPNLHTRLLSYFVNEVRQSDMIVIRGDFGALNDNTAASQDMYFYIGDYITRALNNYNFVAIYPNPINQLSGKSTDEKKFTNSFIFVHDLMAFEGTQATNAENLAPSNCLLGLSGLSQCLHCAQNYALDTLFACKLKSRLPSYTVYMKNHEIFMECGVGLFYETTLNFCQFCPSGCAECTSLSVCQVRSSGCPANCKRCSASNSQCQECNTGYTLDGSFNCLNCNSNKLNCDVCLASNTNLCERCSAGRFFDTASTSCQSCDPSCATCETKSNNCLTCPADKYLTTDNQCITLPSGTFKWKGTEILRKCFPKCKTCQGSDREECLSCETNFVKVFSSSAVLSNLDTHSCERACPVTHYITDTYKSVTAVGFVFCLPCDVKITNCQTCVHQIPYTQHVVCSKCKTGYFVEADPVNTYQNSCKECDANCESCVGDKTNCLSCKTGFKLSRNSGTGKFTCVENTDPYPADNVVCEYDKFLYKGQCVYNCPVGSYKRTRGTDDCTDCRINTPGCFQCHNITTVCSGCWADHKSQNSGASCFFCNGNLAQCCDENKKGIHQGICLACTDNNCLKCYTKDFCTTCGVGFFPAADGSCKAALPSCSLYSYSGANCIGCETTKALSSGSCTSSCSANTFNYVNQGALECTGCDPLCQTCTKPLSNYYCGTTTSSCIEGAVANLGGTCTECLNRLNCNAGQFGSNVCTCNGGQCKTGLKEISGVCYTNCPEGYFDNAGTCTACQGCKVCVTNGANGCTAPIQCMTGYRLIADTVAPISAAKACCATGQYFDGSSCQNCATNCKECTGSAASACTKGNDGFFPNGASLGTCVSIKLNCTASGSTLKFSEACKYGEIAYLNGASWTASCHPASAVTDCEKAFTTSGGNGCLQCATNKLLVLSTSLPSCVAASSCSSGSTELSSVTYRHQSREFRGGLCAPNLANCKTFDTFERFGCTECNAGYYLIKTKNKFNYFGNVPNPAWEKKEITLCGKCHSECTKCIDYSPFACTECPSSKILFFGVCVTSCPTGYKKSTGSAPFTCEIITTALDDYTITGQLIGFKRCPIRNTYLGKSWFAQNSTMTCEQCHSSCLECWGATDSSCRLCDEASKKYADGKGACITCPRTGHDLTKIYAPDNYTNFQCVLSSMASNGRTTYLEITDPAQKITFTHNLDGTASEVQNRTCYMTMIQFDFKLKSKSTWNNKKVIVKRNGVVVRNFHISQYDFINYDGTDVDYERIWQKIYLNNTNCTTNTTELEIHHDVSTFALGDIFGVKDIRVYYMMCGLNCESCDSFQTCNTCKQGMFFYQKQLSSDVWDSFCANPYTTLVTDSTEILEVQSFLFKTGSFFLLFKKEMNFTEEMEKDKPYFIPELSLDFTRTQPIDKVENTTNTTGSTSTATNGGGTSSRRRDRRRRGLQTTTKTSENRTATLFFRASNLLEIQIDNYNESAPSTAMLKFKFPLIEKSVEVNGVNTSTGYTWVATSIEALMIASSPPETALAQFVRYITDVKNKEIPWLILTLVLVFFNFTYGANWLLLDTCQKLYLLLFVNSYWMADTQDLVSFMEFSFFSWYQKFTQQALGQDSTYWLKSKYEEYIESFTRTTPVDQDFINFIPEYRLGQFKVRTSFLLNMDLVLVFFAFLVAVWLLMRLIRWFVKCKWHYKKNWVARWDGFNKFFTWKVFVRYVLFTSVPIFFYGFANLKKFDSSDENGRYSLTAGRICMSLYGFFLGLITLATFLRPLPIDMGSDTRWMRFRRWFSIPFEEYLTYLKNPDPAITTHIKRTIKNRVEDVDPLTRVHHAIGGFDDDEEEGINQPKPGEPQSVSYSLVAGKLKPNTHRKVVKKSNFGAKKKKEKKEKDGYSDSDEIKEEDLEDEGEDGEGSKKAENSGDEEEKENGDAEEDNKPKKLLPERDPTRKKRGFIGIKKLLAMEDKKDSDEDDDDDSDDDDSEKEGGEEKEGEEGEGEGDEAAEENGAAENDDDNKEQGEAQEEGKEGEEGGSGSDDSDSDSDSDDTDSDSEELAKLNNMNDVGRLLGLSIMKVQNKGECCSCDCLTKNPAAVTFNNLLERCSCFYPILRVFHGILLGYLAWNYQSNPGYHIAVFLYTQSLFMLYAMFVRPYEKVLMNFALILIELFFCLFALGLFLEISGLIQRMGLTEEMVDAFYRMLGMFPTYIVVAALFSFLVNIVGGLIQFCIYMTKKKGDLEEDDEFEDE